MINDNSFVMFESAYKQVMHIANKVSAEAAIELLKDIGEFGLNGVWPEEDSMSFVYGFEQIATSISSAKDRRAKNKEDGAKGGRPKVTLEKTEVMTAYKELGTWAKVAARFNISERALRDKRKEWEKDLEPEEKVISGKNISAYKENDRQKPENSGSTGKNLNVNVNVKDNVNAPLGPRSVGASPQTPKAPDGVNEIVKIRREFDF